MINLSLSFFNLKFSFVNIFIWFFEYSSSFLILENWVSSIERDELFFKIWIRCNKSEVSVLCKFFKVLISCKRPSFSDWKCSFNNSLSCVNLSINLFCSSISESFDNTFSSYWFIILVSILFLKIFSLKEEKFDNFNWYSSSFFLKFEFKFSISFSYFFSNSVFSFVNEIFFSFKFWHSWDKLIFNFFKFWYELFIVDISYSFFWSSFSKFRKALIYSKIWALLLLLKLYSESFILILFKYFFEIKIDS